jgi:NADH:ubiquinone oxidoreductase subunit 4 (subunit M)
MAAYYALRLYQHAMHNRKREGLESREIGWRQGTVIGALVACIVALAFYPQVILERTDASAEAAIEAVTPDDTAEARVP